MPLLVKERKDTMRKIRAMKPYCAGMFIFMALIAYCIYCLCSSDFIFAEITQINPLHNIRQPLMSDASDNIGISFTYSYNGQEFKEDSEMIRFGAHIGQQIMIPVNKSSGEYMPDASAVVLILIVGIVAVAIYSTLFIIDCIEEKLRAVS